MNVARELGRRDFLKTTALTGVAGVAGGFGIPKLDVANTPPIHSAESPPLADRYFDSQEFCLAVYDDIKPVLAFDARDVRSPRAWQATARAKIIELLGGFPSRRVALRPEVVEHLDFGTYTRERVVFDTREHLTAVGYLLLPAHRRSPLPVIVCLPGHGRGVTDILGLNDDGTPREERGVGYSKEYGMQCLGRGYAVFALEQLGFGARRDAAARREGPAANSCRPAACAALLLGQTMIGWRTWDAMRAIDYLATRPEVDASRIATLGASGGGTTSLFTAALDDRVKVGVVSAYFNTFRDSIVSLSHCPDNYVPGMLESMEMSDVAGLIAPRRLFVEGGERDPIFPVKGFQTAVAKAERIYDAFGVPDHFDHELHDGVHEFRGTRAFEFLARYL
jgi:dienelactone hydrolase